MGMAGLVATALSVGSGLASARSQTTASAGTKLAASAKFEVASIRQLRPSDMRDRRGGILNPPNDGRFYAATVTVKTLVVLAYDVLPSQIAGGPDWIDSQSFDIQAKADSATDAELRNLNPLDAKLVKEHMLQALLADRFNLTLRHDTKQLPIYVLEVAKNGPRLQQAKGVPLPPWAANDGTDNLSSSKIARGVDARANGGEEHLDFPSFSTSFLAKVLTPLLGRVVVDKTELLGQYNIKLHWASMGPMVMHGPGGEPGMPPGENGAPSTAPPAPSGPSIFTAIQEQLGLKLTPTKGPVQALVIENVDKPSEN